MNEPTIIVLEGPDGAGKSTLAATLDALHAEPGREVHHWHYGPHDPDKTSLEEYLEPLKRWYATHRDTRDVLIIDRFHIGETIYGPLLRGSSRMSKEDRQEIDAYLRSVKAICLYVRPSISVLAERFQQRGDDLVDLRQLDHLVRRYDIELGTSRDWVTITDQLANLFHGFVRSAR